MVEIPELFELINKASARSKVKLANSPNGPISTALLFEVDLTDFGYVKQIFELKLKKLVTKLSHRQGKPMSLSYSNS